MALRAAAESPIALRGGPGGLAKITHTHGDRYMEKGAGALPLADSVCAAASVTMECLYTLGPFSPRQEEEDGMP